MLTRPCDEAALGLACGIAHGLRVRPFLGSGRQGESRSVYVGGIGEQQTCSNAADQFGVNGVTESLKRARWHARQVPQVICKLCRRAHSRGVMYRRSHPIIGTCVVVIAMSEGAVVGLLTRTPEARN